MVGGGREGGGGGYSWGEGCCCWGLFRVWVGVEELDLRRGLSAGDCLMQEQSEGHECRALVWGGNRNWGALAV